MVPAPSISDLQSHLGFWLRAVSNHVSHAFATKLTGKDVTVAEWVMLRSLHDEAPMSPSHLAARMNMTRGAITKLADRLVAKSLVVRKASRDDGRAHTLALTARGSALVPVLAQLADQNDAEFFAHLSRLERAELERLLKGIIERGRMNVLPIE